MRKWLYILVFFSGLTSLAVEMAASRLLGNYFGTSNLVWASIIGLILIYLTAGYFIGGHWADRSPKFDTFVRILIWAAFSIGIIPLLSRPILRLAANAFDELRIGVLFGSFTSVMVLFIVPITLLGTASPFAIRLALTDSRQAGSISGKIYAISTLGSFMGTFLPGLVLIPLVGTYRTFLMISASLLILAMVGLWAYAGLLRLLPYLWMPVVLILLAIFGTWGTDKSSIGLIYEAESAYNYIQVLEIDGVRALRLNEGQGVHSVYKPDQIFFNGPWEQVLIAPYFYPAPVAVNSIENLAIVGLAAGTTARQAERVYPGIQIDGIEIDPKIVAVGREYFDMNQPNLNVIIQDGRWALAHSPKTYQIISVDAYRPPYIPWHLTTVEFFQTVFNHLTADGVMVINVGRSPNDRRLVNALASTILMVFPSAHIVDLPESFNSLIFASREPTQSNNLLENYAILRSDPDTPELLLQAMTVAVNNIHPAAISSEIFTDDRANIEWITNAMILDYMLFGDMETLQ